MRLRAPYDRLLAPVFVPSFVMAISQEAMLILLPLYVVESGQGAALAAFVVALRGVGVLLFDVPAGMLVARFGDKPVLLGGLAATLFGMALLAVSANPVTVSIAALILGVGFAAWMLGRQSYVADICAASETGRAIAVMAGVQRAGAFVGPMLGGTVALYAGYPAAFLVGAACAALAILSVLRFAVATQSRAAAEHQGLAGAQRVLREQRHVFATAGIAALTLQLMRSTRQLLVPLFGAAIGLDVATIGALYSISAVIDMCLFYPVGLLVDRRGRKWSAIPTMLLFAAGLALLPWADGVYSLGLVALLLGFANGLGTGIVMIIGADFSHQAANRGQFLGVWRVIADTGVASAPLLTGVLIGVASLAAASLSVAAIGLAGAGVMAFLVTETLQRPREDLRSD